MADVRCKGKMLRGKEESAGEIENLGNERADDDLVLTLWYKRVKTLEVYSGGPR